MNKHKYGAPDGEMEQAVARQPRLIRDAYELGALFTSTRVGYGLGMGIAGFILGQGASFLSNGDRSGWIVLGGGFLLGVALTVGSTTDATRRKQLSPE